LVLALAAPAGAAECQGDECQPPSPAPEEIVPGTAVAEGPPNPPARFPKSPQKPNSKGKKKAKQGKKGGGRRGGRRGTR
jgi:hypothetical protein